MLLYSFPFFHVNEGMYVGPAVLMDMDFMPTYWSASAMNGH